MLLEHFLLSKPDRFFKKSVRFFCLKIRVFQAEKSPLSSGEKPKTQMPKTKVFIRQDSTLARLAAGKLKSARVAMVVRRTIHLWGVSAIDFLKDEHWVCHELEHVAQYERLGTLGFLWKYAGESIRKGYYKNALEVAAAVRSETALYCSNMPFRFRRQSQKTGWEMPEKSDFSVANRPPAEYLCPSLQNLSIRSS